MCTRNCLHALDTNKKLDRTHQQALARNWPLLLELVRRCAMFSRKTGELFWAQDVLALTAQIKHQHNNFSLLRPILPGKFIQHPPY